MKPEDLQAIRERVNAWLGDAGSEDPLDADPEEGYNLASLNLTLLDEIERLLGALHDIANGIVAPQIVALQTLEPDAK